MQRKERAIVNHIPEILRIFHLEFFLPDFWKFCALRHSDLELRSSMELYPNWKRQVLTFDEMFSPKDLSLEWQYQILISPAISHSKASKNPLRGMNILNSVVKKHLDKLICLVSSTGFLVWYLWRAFHTSYCKRADVLNRVSVSNSYEILTHRKSRILRIKQQNPFISRFFQAADWHRLFVSDTDSATVTETLCFDTVTSNSGTDSAVRIVIVFSDSS